MFRFENKPSSGAKRKIKIKRFVFKPKYWAIGFINIYFFALFFCLLFHRLAVRISLPFHIFLQV